MSNPYQDHGVHSSELVKRAWIDELPTSVMIGESLEPFPIIYAEPEHDISGREMFEKTIAVIQLTNADGQSKMFINTKCCETFPGSNIYKFTFHDANDEGIMLATEESEAGRYAVMICIMRDCEKDRPKDKSKDEERKMTPIISFMRRITVEKNT